MKFWSCSSISVGVKKTKEIQQGENYGVALIYEEKKAHFSVQKGEY